MNDHPKIITLRVILQVSIFLIILPGLPLIISRRWDWWQAWAYALLTILSFIISRLIAAQRHPSLIAERSRFMQHENAKSWDRTLAPLIGLLGIPVMVLAGLDDLFSWSPDFSATGTILAFSSKPCTMKSGSIPL